MTEKKDTRLSGRISTKELKEFLEKARKDGFKNKTPYNWLLWLGRKRNPK